MNQDKIDILFEDYQRLGSYEAVAEKYGFTVQYVKEQLKWRVSGKKARSREPSVSGKKARLVKDIDTLVKDYQELGSCDAVARKYGCTRQYIWRLIKDKVERPLRPPEECKFCKGKAVKHGKRPNGKQRYLCRDCGKQFTFTNEKRGPKPLNGIDALTPIEKYHRWKANRQKKRDRAKGGDSAPE